MPYLWGVNDTLGYYGSDQLLERLFEKPIVSTAALDGYVTNANTSANLIQIRASVKFDRTDEFKALLDMLNIKYIVQRNDVQSDMVGRNLKSPTEMQSFFAEQPYLKLVQSFGKVDIYEYTEAKPSIFALLPSTLEKTDIHIDRNTILNTTWTFSTQDSVQEWNSSSITVNSPLFTADNESSYLITVHLALKNDYPLQVKVAEYSGNMELLTNSSIWGTIPTGTYDFYTVGPYRFEPENQMTKYFNVQIWNHSQSSLMMGNISIVGTVSTLTMTGLENLYGNPLDNQNTQILQVKNVSPEKIIATVNTTQPFILVTGQVLDRFWVANVNGQKVSPIPVYLGLKGFMINGTGQFDVTIVYEPQDWFNYCLAISEVTLLILCVGLVYLNRKTIRAFIKKNQ